MELLHEIVRKIKQITVAQNICQWCYYYLLYPNKLTTIKYINVHVQLLDGIRVCTWKDRPA